jgi:hypothetical protein
VRGRDRGDVLGADAVYRVLERRSRLESCSASAVG